MGLADGLDREEDHKRRITDDLGALGQRAWVPGCTVAAFMETSQQQIWEEEKIKFQGRNLSQPLESQESH